MNSGPVVYAVNHLYCRLALSHTLQSYVWVHDLESVDREFRYDHDGMLTSSTAGTFSSVIFR